MPAAVLRSLVGRNQTQRLTAGHARGWVPVPFRGEARASQPGDARHPARNQLFPK